LGELDRRNGGGEHLSATRKDIWTRFLCFATKITFLSL